MQKKIFLFIILILFSHGCDYSPIHSIKENNIEIKITNITGDNQVNDYLSRELKRKSKNSKEKIEVEIDTSFSKKILAKDTKSSATDYELKVIGNFKLTKGNKTKLLTISEKFRYKNLNNNYEQKNYEAMIKRNLAKIIVSKLNLRIKNFK